MKKTKQRSRTAIVDTPVAELTTKQTLQHYNAIMIEEFNSKIDLVLEGMESLRHELRVDMAAFRNEVNSRFDLVEAAIKCNSQGIRELNAKMDRLSSRVDDHEERLVQANL